MIESLMSVTITTIAGAALLTSIGAAVRTSSDSVHSAVAMGLAEQLMDEIASTRFPDPASTASLTGSSTLWWPRSRETFDDVDAYAGWNSTPPCDRSGHPVGTEGYQLWGYEIPRLYQMRPNQDLVNRMTRQVTVERVRENGSSGWVVETGASNFRRVTVRISLTDAQSQTRTLAAISRIFSYVPLTP